MPILGNTITCQSDIDIGQYLDSHDIDIGQYYWLLGKHTENTLCGQGNVIPELICARFNNKVQGEEPKIIGVSIIFLCLLIFEKKSLPTPTFRKFTSVFLRKWRQRGRFLGTFEHQRRNRYIPIYRTRYSPIQK